MAWSGNTGGSEQAECLRCGGMEGTPVIISDEQLGWYRQMKSACHSKEKLKRFKASFAVTAEEGFQFYGSQVFPEDVYDWVRENAIAPKWTGEFANEDFTGSGTVWHAQKGTYCDRCKAKHCPHCHQDHSELDMHYKIWEWPQKGRRYHLAIDSAYGMDQGDFGVVTVIKIGHGLGEADEQVAEYRAVIDGEAIAIHGYILAKLYNDCVMAPEVRSGPGEATLLQLRKMGVSNIWMWKHPDSKNILSNKLGWVTQSNTKPKLITHFISWSRQRILKIRSLDFLYEMPSFIKEAEDDDSGRATGGRKDDTIMANLIAAYTSHDEDWDYDSGRVIIPGRYRPGVATLDGNIGNYMVTCMRGHKMNVENPARWECPECRKAEDIAVFAQSAIKINASSPQRTIDLTKGRIPDLHEVLATAQSQDQYEIV